MQMGLRCSNGHTRGCDRVAAPGESFDLMLCRQCHAEVVFFAGLPCPCGSTEFTFRPVRGEDNPTRVHDKEGFPMVHIQRVFPCRAGRWLERKPMIAGITSVERTEDEYLFIQATG